LIGTLADAPLRRKPRLGIRVIVDLVPNHTSWDHQWFREALAAAEGSLERDRYIFRDGLGTSGEIPPNNWESVFGGSMWTRTTNPDGTPGQWYLHIFDTSQPDLNWENQWVREQFRDILRFWLDRGVDGFRVDVAHGLIKEAGLPDYTPPAEAGSMGGNTTTSSDSIEPADVPTPPYWAQDSVHEIYRDWNPRPVSKDGSGTVCRSLIKPCKLAHGYVPMKCTSFPSAISRPSGCDRASPSSTHRGVFHFGWHRAPGCSIYRAPRNTSVADFENWGVHQAKHQGYLTPPVCAGLAPPQLDAAFGSAYIYQGEELGLPEDVSLPDEARQDPTWFRTNGERYGRDGCRVPIPWEAGKPSYGFGPGSQTWLPQPDNWDGFVCDSQRGAGPHLSCTNGRSHYEQRTSLVLARWSGCPVSVRTSSLFATGQ
jgi:alpha-glucosidase